MGINVESQIKIYRRKIGTGYPTYIIAEIGSNHNGDFNTAEKMMYEAAKAGVDAVKFQSFKAEKHYSKHTPEFSYLKKQKQTKSIYNLIQSLEIDREWNEKLASISNNLGIHFLSSPCDYDAIDELLNVDMPAFKVASFDLTDLDLIHYMAKYNRPIILSTGMASYGDIQAAISTIKKADGRQAALLQCTSLYPAPPDLANLYAIKTMKKAFGVPVGYSDHTVGEHCCLAAVALGANIIEKHYTLDRTMEGPDHSFAIEPDELSTMIRHIREIEAALGDGIKDGPREEEAEMYEKGRRSLHVCQDIKAGEVISRDKLVIKRPGYGISPRDIDLVVGMTSNNDIMEDHWITWGDFK